MSRPTRPARKPLASSPASRPDSRPFQSHRKPIRRWPSSPTGTSASTSRCAAGPRPCATTASCSPSTSCRRWGSSRSPRSSASTFWHSTTSCVRCPRWRTGRSRCWVKMFNLAEAWEQRPPGKNPCRFVRRYKVQPQHERFLTPEELQRLGRALDAAPAERLASRHGAAAIRLLVLTGCRRNEILGLRWEGRGLRGGRASPPRHGRPGPGWRR